MTIDRAFDTGLRPEDVDPERPEPFDTPWGSFALHLVDGEPLAVQSFCPHLAGPLFQGSRRGAQITCPWHLWRFDLRSGLCLAGPDPGVAVPRLASLAVRLNARGTLELLAPPTSAPD